MTTSLATSKLLRNAGWPQQTEHWYCHDDRDGKFHLEKCRISNGVVVPIAAPNTDELLAALPLITDQELEDGGSIGPIPLTIRPTGTIAKPDGWEVSYHSWYCRHPKEGVNEHGEEIFERIEASTLVEALAALWLELRKQKEI